MKFTGEHYGEKVTIEYDHDDVLLEDAIEAVINLLTAMGYMTVRETMKEVTSEDV